MHLDVWTYWTGPLPEWIETCVRSFRRCCKESTLHVLAPDNLPDGLDLNRRWLDLNPGVGTDCLRAALLAQFGGLWVDADTIMVRDPINLFRLRHRPEEFLYQRWSAPPDRITAGYCYAPKGHPVAMRWKAAVDATLCWGKQVGWGQLGEKVLTSIVHSTGKDVWEIPRETFMPVDVDRDVQRYFQPSGWRDFVTPDTIGFGLNYSWMMEHRAGEMARNPDYGNLMIHKLLADEGRL